MNRDRLHAHILVEMRKHRTNMRLNFPKIKVDVQMMTELPHQPYFNAQLIPRLQLFEELQNKIRIYGNKFNQLNNINQ